MNYKLLIVIGFSVISGACAQTPPSVQAPAPDRAAAPVDRPPVVTTPYYAVAVSRPDRTNDYPVEYRVQVPDTDSRVRVVERMVYGDLRLQQQGETVGRSTGSPGVTVGNK